jgi:hypothetical protein
MKVTPVFEVAPDGDGEMSNFAGQSVHKDDAWHRPQPVVGNRCCWKLPEGSWHHRKRSLP